MFIYLYYKVAESYCWNKWSFGKLIHNSVDSNIRSKPNQMNSNIIHVASQWT